MFYIDNNKSEGERLDVTFISHFYSYDNERNNPLL
jgi:hypothetical protein